MFIYIKCSKLCSIFEMGKIEWGCIDWIVLAKSRDWWRAPYNVRKFLSSCTTDSFSRRAQFHEISLKWALEDVYANRTPRFEVCHSSNEEFQTFNL
jgi:hypothetical protein